MRNLTWVIWTSLFFNKTLSFSLQRFLNHLALDGTKTRNLTYATQVIRSKRLSLSLLVALEDSRKMNLLEKRSLSASMQVTKRILLFKSKLSRLIQEDGTRRQNQRSRTLSCQFNQTLVAGRMSLTSKLKMLRQLRRQRLPKSLYLKSLRKRRRKIKRIRKLSKKTKKKNHLPDGAMTTLLMFEINFNFVFKNG